VSIVHWGVSPPWVHDFNYLSVQLPANFLQVKALAWMNWWISSGNPWEIESSASSQPSFNTAVSSSSNAPGGSYANLPLLTKLRPP
jgi:hypothetical protein